jgi:hypothetical protein
MRWCAGHLFDDELIVNNDFVNLLKSMEESGCGNVFEDASVRPDDEREHRGTLVGAVGSHFRLFEVKKHWPPEKSFPGLTTSHGDLG